MERELRKLGLEPKAVTREESASPATGSLTLHKAEELTLNHGRAGRNRLDEMSFSSHFCRGYIPLAFVFSVPGKEEMRVERPVAGETGKNLQLALIHLNSAQQAYFPSLDRYDYRITNAFSTPMAKALGHSASEASNAEIRADPNVRRVIQEIEGCDVVVLSGNKARLLATDVGAKGMIVVEVPHVGNTGLNVSYEVPDRLKVASSGTRRKYRVRLWADAVLRAIAGEDR